MNLTPTTPNSVLLVGRVVCKPRLNWDEHGTVVHVRLAVPIHDPRAGVEYDEQFELIIEGDEATRAYRDVRPGSQLTALGRLHIGDRLLAVGYPARSVEIVVDEFALHERTRLVAA